ncbi:hypothetical protein JX265_008835 [Neoarthrinium moseri]|uniref:Uncharacterized protein n=1 Tax=Neoarthrinium moseri TaxID=1658444 RepID=A0A9P9WH18_9PEZI|nr:uncharacterized protein JN550_009551 [Neoarthrinium moseri]KAI1848384.1 hypothetical protein JX266_005690 [Neoarthrinium moseri]KAI1863440.1 hypothetical protein JN550_009551 [Neoarthrinium moseri]KAI1863618.1 hypothetical protein JX265_008835 [Neoarthrinium moseri]
MNFQSVIENFFGRSQTPAITASQAPPANPFARPERPGEPTQPAPTSTALQLTQARLPTGDVGPTTTERGFAIVPYVVERAPGTSTKVTLDGQPINVTDPQALAIVQQGIRDGSLAQQGLASSGTTIQSHVPLGPGNDPNSFCNDPKWKFRIMIQWVNEIDRLRPDLEYARAHGWQKHIAKLSRQIGALERQIATRLRKLGHNKVFTELIPAYPQVWKYLDPSYRRRLENFPAAHIPPSRQLEAPACAHAKEEDDNFMSLSSTITNQPRSQAKEAIPHETFDGLPIKREETQAQNTSASNGIRAPQTARPHASQLTAPSSYFDDIPIKRETDHTGPDRSARTRLEADVSVRQATQVPRVVEEVEKIESDDDDCFIVEVRDIKATLPPRRGSRKDRTRSRSSTGAQGHARARVGTPYRDRN